MQEHTKLPGMRVGFAGLALTRRERELLIQHGEVSTPFGLSLACPELDEGSKPCLAPFDPSSSSGRTDFKHHLVGSIV